MCFTLGLKQLVATLMLKLWQLKAEYCYTYVKPFEPHEPHVILVEYDMYLRLLIFIIWIKLRMGNR